jgi:isoquinoline 1-oxidoreductase beta subunit
MNRSQGQTQQDQRVELVSRRGFMGTVFSAGALVLGMKILPMGALAAATVDHVPREIPIDGAPFHPNLFVGIESDGTVRIVAHRSEMGTGIRTSLPMVLADELEADWSKVKVQQALGNPAYGSQDTDGSHSITDFYDSMRQIGATARLMLERAAAMKWSVPVSECKTQNHFVVHASDGRKLGFGELATLAAHQPVPKPEELRLKDASEFRYIGKGVPIVDLDEIVTGQSIFGMDIALPGMVYASIERPPVLGGKLKSYDDSEAKKVAGVIGTTTLDAFKPPHEFQPLGGIAVIATNTWAATQARKKLKIEWDLGPNAIYDSTSYKKSLIETSQKPQKVVREVGNVDSEFGKGGKTVEAQYYTPLLAHVPMEPPVATALYKDGKVDIWTSTQNPQAVQSSAAKYLGLKPEDITCHVPLLGGGFGRKSKPDYSTEAAYLSKQLGKPVKVVWSREDDVHFDYFHSTAAMYFKAQVDEKGMPVAWLQRSVFPPIGSTFDPTAEYGEDECNLGFTDIPFDVKNLRAENGPAKAHVRIGWMRSVSNIYHAYGVEGFADELAHAAGRDPIEYWLELLGPDRVITFDGEHAKYTNYGKPLSKYPFDTARLRKVAQVAAEKSDWKNKRAQGKALGFAAHRSFLTYVAAVVEVEVDSKGKLTIPRIDLAVDCGQVIHPDRVKAQFEGAAVFGVSVALMGEITASDGRINQSNFHNYKVARMNEAPRETFVHLAPGSNLPTGTGEPGVPPVAPAICNAIFAATGKRIRELPVSKTKLV